MIKNVPANAGDVSLIPGSDPPEEGMATQFSFIVEKIPWTEGPGRLHSTGTQRI